MNVTSGGKTPPSLHQISVWLEKLHDAVITDLSPLSGGFWSSAFSYRLGNQDFVLRLSEMAEGFAIDKAAMRFAHPGLPIPAVVSTGETLGLHYAISERHFGRLIETVPADEGVNVGNALGNLLSALRAVATDKDDAVMWYDPEQSRHPTWHEWLNAGLIDNPDARVHGWRKILAEQPAVDRLFTTCVSRIQELLPVCPERRDLIHGDLLHQNVLVSEDASEVTAVFSWKCSAYGDFLFDVAWCTFWSGWHPGIAAADILSRTLTAQDLTPSDLQDASLRHYCYELQIGASHLGWNAWTGNQKDLYELSRVLERRLAEGPLHME